MFDSRRAERRPGSGIRSDLHESVEHTLEAADRRVRIEMRGGAESLNVSVATGIALYVLTGR